MDYLVSHSVERITAHLLRDLELGSHPSNGEAWPVFYSHKPDKPDNCLTAYGTVGTQDGRLSISGEVVAHPGVMIHVRSSTSESGSSKAQEITQAFDTAVFNTEVIVGDTTYIVRNAFRRGDPIPLGQSEQTANRYLFSINYLLTISIST